MAFITLKMEISETIEILRRATTKAQNGQNDEDFIKMLGSITKQIKMYESIDQEMVTSLKSYFNEALKHRQEYDDVVNSLKAGSVLIYFKPAQRIKVYTKEELDTVLGGELRTVYKQFPGAYEVVPHNIKQKIIIVGEASLWDKIPSIKTHILKFMHSKGLKQITTKDIVAYKNDMSVDIIINNYYVSNAAERDSIVNDLVQYIYDTDRNDDLASKLGKRMFSDFNNANMYSVGTNKQQWMADPKDFLEFVDALVSNTTDCVQINKSGNTYNVTLNVNIQNQQAEVIVNGNNNNNDFSNNTNIIVEDSFNQRIVEFIDMIKNERPDWYLEGKWVRRVILSEKYSEIYDDAPHSLYKALRGRLFIEDKKGLSKNTKSGREFYVKLLPFNSIV